ncbi:hypothetical protein F2Q69_00063587 [Brassica cretica]|uniref:Uncharacterized protein n=1 Tax=Brassica cretica TaxID=69181 RepID=A0A8S9RQX5_BRACR|nr:hypothetical protein F2Q69_00063587 [Brassica cretica]
MSTPKPHTVPKPKKAHDHEPKEISSSVLTHQAGFKRSAQLNKVQPQPITTPLPELQKLQEMCQRLKETLEPKEENTSNQGTETKDHMYDPHKESTRCLYAKRKQEIVHSHALIPYDPGDQAPPIRVPNQSRGVVMSFLPKGEPPDVPSKNKPIKFQGKVLESQRKMKPDLLYLGADYPVSMLKIFQGRGYDAAIKSVPEPEANQLHQSANQRTNQDMCSVKKAYLTNHE